MATPFIGQIALFGFNFAPQGWALCQGQMMAIGQNVALFEVIGAAFGGNGETTFALPNLQGSAAVGAGQGPGLSNYPIGTSGGTQTVTLTPEQMPAHSHGFNVVTDQGTTASPDGNQLARAWRALAHTDAVANFYSSHPDKATTPLASSSIGPTGSGAPHDNMQPSLTLNFCIALQGINPPR